MAKQQLNHSRYLDNRGEMGKSVKEYQRLRDTATRKQKRYFRMLCAKMRDNGIEPPTPNPHGRMGYIDAIDEAIGVLRDAGVEVVAQEAQVQHYINPGEGKYPGDITRAWTTVQGGKRQRPQKLYNRNGLTRDESGLHYV